MSFGSNVSTRTMRRAFERHGDAVFYGRVSKYAPRRLPEQQDGTKGRFTHGSRTPEKGKHEPNFDMTMYFGRLKIRELWLRAGILVVPFEEEEMRQLMIDAKAQFDADGVVHANTAVRLQAAGRNIDELTQLWGIMDKAEVDISDLDKSAAPLNSFN